MSIDIKPHAYDPARNPELFDGVLARRVVAFVIDFIIIAIPVVLTAMFIFAFGIVTLGIAVPEISDPSRIDGGSPLGAQVFSRRPGRHPSDIETPLARKQGRALAELTRAWNERQR
jgi:hypothetical protein